MNKYKAITVISFFVLIQFSFAQTIEEGGTFKLNLIQEKFDSEYLESGVFLGEGRRFTLNKDIEELAETFNNSDTVFIFRHEEFDKMQSKIKEYDEKDSVILTRKSKYKRLIKELDKKSFSENRITTLGYRLYSFILKVEKIEIDEIPFVNLGYGLNDKACLKIKKVVVVYFIIE